MINFKKTVLAAALLLTFAGFSSAIFAQVQNTTTSFQYDAVGNMTQTTDALGRATNQSYDPLDRTSQVLQPPVAAGARPVIGMTYDGQDQVKSVTDPRSLVTSYTKDGLGNTTGLASPDTGASGNTYDAAGNLLTSTDARGKVTTYAYDVLSRVVSMTYASGTPTTFEYDGGTIGAQNAKGKLTKMSDASGTTSYSYDGFGRMTSKVQTIGTVALTTTYEYGTAGAANGRLIAMTYPSGARNNYAYDAVGRVLAVSLNPVNATGSGTDLSVSINLLTSIAYSPFGPAISWAWGNSTSSNVNTYARAVDLDSRITSYPLGNPVNSGLNRSVVWDAASRITGYAHSGLGSGTAAPANFDQSFNYDNLDRLTGFTGASSTQAFQYDLNGNRVAGSFGATSFINTISASSNRLASTTGPAPAKTNTYAAAGNLVSDATIAYTYSDRGRMNDATLGGNVATYGYNGLGERVSKISTQSQASCTQVSKTTLNAQIRAAQDQIQVVRKTANNATQQTKDKTLRDQIRAKMDADIADLTAQIASFKAQMKTAGSCTPSTTTTAVTTFYSYDGAGHTIGEYDSNGKPIEETIYLGDMPVSVLKQMPSTATAGAVTTNVYYVYADHINTPRVITQATDSQIVWRWDSTDPFGMSQPNENPSSIGAFTYNHRFPGQIYDKETNNHYNYFRDYDPQQGRYVESDPIGLKGGINTFTYVGANPVIGIDPQGLDNPGMGPYNVSVTVYLYGEGSGQHIGVGVNGGPSYGYYGTGQSIAGYLAGFSYRGAVLPDSKRKAGATDAVVISATVDQANSAQQTINNLRRNPGEYNLYTNNCAISAENTLRDAGVPNIPSAMFPSNLLGGLRGR
jgi:RHS repeat-associated protein